MLAYEERIGIDDSGQSPLRKIHLFAYAPQDANVATGECRRQADVRRYCFFLNYANKIIDFLGILESVLQFDIRGMAVESGCRAEGVEHIMPFDGDIPSLFDQFAEG